MDDGAHRRLRGPRLCDRQPSRPGHRSRRRSRTHQAGPSNGPPSAAFPTVNVLTGPNLWEDGARPRDDEGAWSDSLRALNAACAHAAPLGVDVALEPCWGTLTHDVATMRRALADVPCKVNFDPSHFVMEGDDIPAFVRELGDRNRPRSPQGCVRSAGHGGRRLSLLLAR